jgi:hypothetical protein
MRVLLAFLEARRRIIVVRDHEIHERTPSPSHPDRNRRFLRTLVRASAFHRRASLSLSRDLEIRGNGETRVWFLIDPYFLYETFHRRARASASRQTVIDRKLEATFKYAKRARQ